MKIVGIVGTDLQAQKALLDGLSRECGYDRFSVEEDIKEYFSEIPLESNPDMLTMVTEQSNIAQARLVTKIFENAIIGRWGLAISDVKNAQVLDLIEYLGGTLVFVGNKGEASPLFDEQDTHLSIDGVTDTAELRSIIRERIMPGREILPDIQKANVLEAIKMYREVISDLVDQGYDVLTN